MPDIPEFPVNPQGPSEQQPDATVNTQLSDSLSRIATSVDKQADSAERIVEALKRIPSVQEEISRKFKNVNLELEAMVELADDTEEAIKLIASQTKSLRKGIIDTKKTADARKVLESIVKAQKMIQQQMKKGSTEWAASVKIVKDLGHWVDKLGNRVDELTEDELKELNKAMHEAEKTGERIAKNFKQITVNHLTRQIQGMSRALASVGIGKSLNARVEKYAKFAEVPYKMREAQKARIEQNRDAFRMKRESALAAVRERYKDQPIMANPAAQQMLMKQMGIRKALRPEEIAHLAGEGGTKTGTITQMEAHGATMVGQVFSKSATGLENALGNLSGFIAQIGPLLAATEEAVLLLVQAFDAYTKQNKEMETSLAGGGLFTTAAGGRGFTGARTALTPHDMELGLYSTLGLTFERNLKIAQAISEGGQNISELVTGGQRMGMAQTGTLGEFGPGGFGQIQRAVVGAGRVAGLTDTQGVQQVLKMLQQYRSTLEDSEDFFIKVGKAQQAAGISTTKYIGILDEVLNRFSRMNKNLDQAVNVLGELSKTGRLASEDLQGYFDFLVGGAGAKEKTATAEQMFLYGQMSPAEKQQQLQYRQQVYGGTQEQATGLFEGQLGISKADLDKGLKGTNEEVQAFLTNRVVQAINNNTSLDNNQRQSLNNIVERLRKQRQDVDLWQEFASGKISAVQMGMAGGFGGANLQNSMALQQEAIKFILKQSGNMREFLKNPQGFAAHAPQAVKIAERLGITPEEMGQNLAGIQRRGAELRIEAAKSNQQEADALIEQLLKNPSSSKLVKQFQKDSKNSMELFMKHGGDLTEDVAGLNETLDYWGKVAADQQKKADDKDREAALKEARKIAEQTQSSADIIANAFSRWFNEIISGIEFIVDHWPWTGSKEPLSAQDMSDVTKVMADNQKEIADAEAKKRDAEDKGKSKAEIDKYSEQIKALQESNGQLEAIKAQGAAVSDRQKDILEDARKKAGHATPQPTYVVSPTGQLIKTGPIAQTPQAGDTPPPVLAAAPKVPDMAYMKTADMAAAANKEGGKTVNYNQKNTTYMAVSHTQAVPSDHAGDSNETGTGTTPPKRDPFMPLPKQ